MRGASLSANGCNWYEDEDEQEKEEQQHEQHEDKHKDEQTKAVKEGDNAIYYDGAEKEDKDNN